MPTSAIPDLSSEYAISLEAVEAYRRDGHVVLRGVCSPAEVAACREAIAGAVRRLNQESRPMAERDTYGKAFLQTMNLWEEDEDVRRFTLAKRFAGIAAALMDVGRARLYHDQALFKEPGGGHTPWHQDQYYWPLDCRTVTMWMPMVEATTEMGTMRFASGSQRDGYVAALAISDESDDFFESYIREKGYPVAETGTLAVGDASFHNGWTLHAAGGNRTDVSREAMTVIYLEDGATILKPDHASREADLARWFPGLKPGDPAASRLNPIVWP